MRGSPSGGDLHGRAGQRRLHCRCRSAMHAWPGVTVWTDHPAVSCMASQYAGWAISVDKFFAMGSGPLRAHARVEQELFEKLGYAEEAEHGVLVLEGRTLPTDEVAAWVAKKARLSARRSSPSSSRRRRASREASRSRPAFSRPASTKWRRSGSTCVGSSARSARRRFRRSPRTISAPSAAPTTASCTAGRRAIRFRAGDAELAALAAKVPASASARLRHAVLRHLPAVRGRLLQDRSAAVQPGGSLADQRGDRADLPRRGAQSRVLDARRCYPS